MSIERDELSKQLENSDRWRGNISDAWVELKEQNDELVAAIKPAIEWLTKWEAGDWTRQYLFGVEVLKGLKAALAKVE